MHADRGDQSSESADRGQTAVLGIVLLIGMVAIVSVSMLLVASGTLTDAEGDAEQEQVEQAFVELSHGIASATTDGDVSQSLDLDAGEHGAIAHHDSATYNITAGNESEKRPIANGTIGTIEYESDDGTRIAYEGGGVFKETGSETEILSTPPSEYDHGTNTLSFPVVTLAEDKTISSGDVHVSQEDVTPEAMNYVEGDNVYIELESDYCRGWEQHFTDQAGSTTIQQSCYGDENDDGLLYIRLGYENFDAAFSTGVSLSDHGNYDYHNSGESLDNLSEGNFEPIDDTIDEMVEDYAENETPMNDESVDLDSIEGGHYFVSEGSIDGENELTFNLEDEDAIVVIDDDISGYDVTVESCGSDQEKQVKLYSTGNLNLNADDSVFDQKCGDSVGNLQVFGKSTMAVNFHNGDFEGLLYAASDKNPEGDFDGWETETSTGNADTDSQIFIQASPEFEGSIVAHSIQEGSNFHNFNTYGIDDPDVNVIPPGYEPAPQLTYLNLAEHEIDIANL